MSAKQLTDFRRRAEANGLTDDQRERIVALHEAAHVAYLTDQGLPVDYVSIVPTPTANGSAGAPFPATGENFLKAVTAVLVAGLLESSLTGTSNISGDLAELRRLSGHFSLNPDQFAETLGSMMDSAAEWISTHTPQVLAVAQRLYEKKTLTGIEVLEAVQSPPSM